MMNLRILLVPLASLLLAAPNLHAQSPSPTPTVDDLVAKNLKAKGSADALDAIQTIRFEGRMLVNQGQLELKFTQTKKRPDKSRTDAALQGMARVQSYDRRKGWHVFPFQGRKDPEGRAGGEGKTLREEAKDGGAAEA